LAQIQKVWRGERAQRGRFREFTQCDVDIVGSGGLAVAHDAEMPSVIDAAFNAIGVPAFKVHVSNRKILGGLFAEAGLDEARAVEALRVVDRYGRGDEAGTVRDLEALGCPPALIDRVTTLVVSASIPEAAKALREHSSALAGLDELAEVCDRAVALGMPESRLEVDLSIARGLDYYTGTVYETFLDGREDWGSVCSGGRYDDLASTFTNRPHPGVGVSIGLTRLFARLLDAGLLEPGSATPTRVLVTMLDPDGHLDAYLGFARELRAAGIPTEVVLEGGSLRRQLAYASRKGIPLAVIAGEREFADGVVLLRDLDRGTQEPVPAASLVAAIAGPG
jgi:histidyl-tRNA synthetase